MNGKKEKLSYAEGVTPKLLACGEFVCIEVGEEDFKDRLGQMECCLVGWWEEASSPILELEAVRRWVISSWMPKGRLNLVRLDRKLLLFKLETLSKADRVLKFGRWSLRGYPLQLERWNQNLCCVQSTDWGKEVWVKVVGLPVHLWNRKVLKKIGNECGGFIAMDEDTTSLVELLWARILVKCKGKDTPKTAEVRAGSISYLLQLWWEFPSELRFVRPQSKTVKQKRKGPKEDRDVIKEKLTRLAAQIMRGHSRQGLGSVGSSSKSVDLLEERVPDKGGLVGAVSPTKVDREEPIPLGPPMSAHLGTPSYFDGLDV